MLSPSLNLFLYDSLSVLYKLFSASSSSTKSSPPSFATSVTSIVPESTIPTRFSVAEPSSAIKVLSKFCPLIIIPEFPHKRYSPDSMSENLLFSKILS